MNTRFDLTALTNTYHSMLTTLGVYFLSMEVGHSTGKPMPVLKLLFPSNWLIPEDPQFIVEAEYFSEEETLYYIGLEPSNPYSILDDVVRYASGVVKYNDAVEAKKLELAELIRQKELILEQSIQEYRANMEADGVKFKTIVVKRPEPVVVNYPQTVVLQVPDNTISQTPDNSINQYFPEDQPTYLTPPKRPALPASVDPRIFSDEDEPIDPRETLPFNSSSGLMIVAEQPRFDRNSIEVQRHDNDSDW